MIIPILKLILAAPFVFFVPGFFMLLAIFGWKGNKMTFFERASLAVPLSIIIIDLIILFLNKIGILIRGPVLIGSISIFCLICYIVFQIRFKKVQASAQENLEDAKLFNFSTWQTVFIVAAIFLAVFIRTTYLLDTIVPSATDLGHHMYWSQTIVDSGKLPSYGVPDFIIGEHIIFAAMNLLSGIGFLTAMPTLILLLINIAGIFTLTILAARMFKNPKVTTLAIFFIGVLYAISAPQTKYVSGGVVGNVIGDMLIPVSFYFVFRALEEKEPIFAGMFIFSFMGLLYTHHLSSFVFIYLLAAVIFLYLILNIKRISQVISEWIKIFLKPFPIGILVIAAIFFILIYTPSYFNTAAVSQATGTPIKVTRVGLNFEQIKANIGSARLFLGMVGFLLVFYQIRRKDYKYSFALGWTAMMFAISWKPGWFYVNIPSDRIGNYLYLPFSLLGAYGIVAFLQMFQKSATKFFSSVLLIILMFFVITDGLSDSADAFHSKNQFQQIAQTFHSARYLAAVINPEKDNILKDHINIPADTWYKIFFMKGYSYPLSRGNLSRYSDAIKSRETCTRDMIGEPDTDQGKMCFASTGVDYVILNAQQEGTTFEKLPDFSKVYSSSYLSIFKKD
jgi:hypothetical protein